MVTGPVTAFSPACNSAQDNQVPLKWHCCAPALHPPSSYLTLLHICQHPQGTQRAMVLRGRAQPGHRLLFRPHETHTTVV